MTDHLWTDDEFRSFFSRLRDTTGPFSMETPDEADRDAFLRQA